MSIYQIKQYCPFAYFHIRNGSFEEKYSNEIVISAVLTSHFVFSALMTSMSLNCVNFE